ncbi:MAG: hypothetical protein EOM08_07840 [Clostridia bacterium]|nr:hypothetical protein [Clostridia bacterium]
MPARDGTGPMGMGARTGRGMGPCGVSSTQPFVGYGYGCGYGRGRGFRRMRAPYPYTAADFDPNAGKVVLQDQVKFLEQELENMKSQLKKYEEQA